MQSDNLDNDNSNQYEKSEKTDGLSDVKGICRGATSTSSLDGKSHSRKKRRKDSSGGNISLFRAFRVIGSALVERLDRKLQHKSHGEACSKLHGTEKTSDKVAKDVSKPSDEVSSSEILHIPNPDTRDQKIGISNTLERVLKEKKECLHKAVDVVSKTKTEAPSDKPRKKADSIKNSEVAGCVYDNSTCFDEPENPSLVRVVKGLDDKTIDNVSAKDGFSQIQETKHKSANLQDKSKDGYFKVQENDTYLVEIESDEEDEPPSYESIDYLPVPSRELEAGFFVPEPGSDLDHCVPKPGSDVDHYVPKPGSDLDHCVPEPISDLDYYVPEPGSDLDHYVPELTTRPISCLLNGCSDMHRPPMSIHALSSAKKIDSSVKEVEDASDLGLNLEIGKVQGVAATQIQSVSVPSLHESSLEPCNQKLGLGSVNFTTQTEGDVAERCCDVSTYTNKSTIGCAVKPGNYEESSADESLKTMDSCEKDLEYRAGVDESIKNTQKNAVSTMSQTVESFSSDSVLGDHSFLDNAVVFKLGMEDDKNNAKMNECKESDLSVNFQELEPDDLDDFSGLTRGESSHSDENGATSGNSEDIETGNIEAQSNATEKRGLDFNSNISKSDKTLICSGSESTLQMHVKSSSIEPVDQFLFKSCDSADESNVLSADASVNEDLYDHGNAETHCSCTPDDFKSMQQQQDRTSVMKFVDQPLAVLSVAHPSPVDPERNMTMGNDFDSGALGGNDFSGNGEVLSELLESMDQIQPKNVGKSELPVSNSGMDEGYDTDDIEMQEDHDSFESQNQDDGGQPAYLAAVENLNDSGFDNDNGNVPPPRNNAADEGEVCSSDTQESNIKDFVEKQLENIDMECADCSDLNKDMKFEALGQIDIDIEAFEDSHRQEIDIGEDHEVEDMEVQGCIIGLPENCSASTELLEPNNEKAASDLTTDSSFGPSILTDSDNSIILLGNDVSQNVIEVAAEMSSNIRDPIVDPISCMQPIIGGCNSSDRSKLATEQRTNTEACADGSGPLNQKPNESDAGMAQNIDVQNTETTASASVTGEDCQFENFEEQKGIKQSELATCIELLDQHAQEQISLAVSGLIPGPGKFDNVSNPAATMECCISQKESEMEDGLGLLGEHEIIKDAYQEPGVEDLDSLDESQHAADNFLTHDPITQNVLNEDKLERNGESDDIRLNFHEQPHSAKQSETGNDVKTITNLPYQQLETIDVPRITGKGGLDSAEVMNVSDETVYGTPTLDNSATLLQDGITQETIKMEDSPPENGTESSLNPVMVQPIERGLRGPVFTGPAHSSSKDTTYVQPYDDVPGLQISPESVSNVSAANEVLTALFYASNAESGHAKMGFTEEIKPLADEVISDGQQEQHLGGLGGYNLPAQYPANWDAMTHEILSIHGKVDSFDDNLDSQVISHASLNTTEAEPISAAELDGNLQLSECDDITSACHDPALLEKADEPPKVLTEYFDGTSNASTSPDIGPNIGENALNGKTLDQLEIDKYEESRPTQPCTEMITYDALEETSGIEGKAKILRMPPEKFNAEHWPDSSNHGVTNSGAIHGMVLNRNDASIVTLDTGPTDQVSIALGLMCDDSSRLNSLNDLLLHTQPDIYDATIYRFHQKKPADSEMLSSTSGAHTIHQSHGLQLSYNQDYLHSQGEFGPSDHHEDSDSSTDRPPSLPPEEGLTSPAAGFYKTSELIMCERNGDTAAFERAFPNTNYPPACQEKNASAAPFTPKNLADQEASNADSATGVSGLCERNGNMPTFESASFNTNHTSATAYQANNSPGSAKADELSYDLVLEFGITASLSDFSQDPLGKDSGGIGEVLQNDEVETPMILLPTSINTNGSFSNPPDTDKEVNTNHSDGCYMEKIITMDLKKDMMCSTVSKCIFSILDESNQNEKSLKPPPGENRLTQCSGSELPQAIEQQNTSAIDGLEDQHPDVSSNVRNDDIVENEILFYEGPGPPNPAATALDTNLAASFRTATSNQGILNGESNDQETDTAQQDMSSLQESALGQSEGAVAEYSMQCTEADEPITDFHARLTTSLSASANGRVRSELAHDHYELDYGGIPEEHRDFFTDDPNPTVPPIPCVGAEGEPPCTSTAPDPPSCNVAIDRNNIREVHLNSDRPFRCYVCGLESHFAYIVVGALHACEDCFSREAHQRSTDRRRAVTRSSEHLQFPKKRYCKHCNQAFISRSPILCKACSKPFCCGGCHWHHRPSCKKKTF